MSPTKKEQAHEKFFSDLLEVAENAAEGGLDVPHAVFVGIQFFTQMALDCAPNKKEAKKLIKDAMRYTLKKHAYMLSQKEDIDAYNEKNNIKPPVSPFKDSANKAEFMT